MIEKIIDAVKSSPRLVVAEDFEICVQKVSVERVHFRNGEKMADGAEVQLWGSLRILHRNRPGTAFGFLPSEGAVAWLVNSAFDSAEQSLADPWFRLPIWKRGADGAGKDGAETPADFFSPLFSKLENVPDLFDEKSERWSLETVLYRRAERETRKYKKRFHAFSLSAKVLEAEAGPLGLRDQRTMLSATSEKLEIAKDLCRLSLAMRSAPAVEFPKGPFALAPRAAVEILQGISPWFLAGESGSPLFTETKPKLAESINIVDDGTMPGLSGSQAFDLEGTWSRKTELVRRGEIQQTLCDTYYATKENRLSTGNRGRLPYAIAPAVQPNNLYLLPQSLIPADVIQTWGKGLYIEAWQGFRLDPKTGEISAEFLGWEIEKGNPVRAVRGEWPAINALQLLTSAQGVGSDLQFFGNMGSPSIFFENIPTSI